MEALLSTQVTKTELLLSKLLPYQVLGSFVMVLCMVVTVYVLDVPYHGSLWLLALVTSPLSRHRAWYGIADIHRDPQSV